MTASIDKELVVKPAFAAVGLRWEGTFEEAAAGQIRSVHRELLARLDDIGGRTDTKNYVGLSYHTQPGGFIHYAVVQVDETHPVPDGLISIHVPELPYVKHRHEKGSSIEASYRNIYAWTAEAGYALRTDQVTHYEEYPVDQDPYSPDPEFTIYLPIHPDHTAAQNK